jgi:FecR protein
MQLLPATVLIITLSLLSPINAWSGVGRVTEQTGPTEILRNKKSISSQINTTVEMNDAVSTARAKAQLTFEDKTTVKLTEHSKIIIDDFVYDPKKGAGKLGMKMALGTARYASGQIAKNNPQQVAIKTPTASIAVRGTDFSMTVDELGRSLVMLLPSCDEKGCVTGAIEVSNFGGVVLLDVPYQATLVNSAYTPPTEPVIVKLDQANINNMLIISKPKEIPDDTHAGTTKKEKSLLDFNELDVDLLKYSKLDENALDKKSSLDRNDLDVDLLEFNALNELDRQNASLLNNELDNPILPGYSANKSLGLLYYFNDDQTKVTLYKAGTHNATVTFDTTKNVTFTLNQSGQTIIQNVNKGATSTVTINQQ